MNQSYDDSGADQDTAAPGGAASTYASSGNGGAVSSGEGYSQESGYDRGGESGASGSVLGQGGERGSSARSGAGGEGSFPHLNADGSFKEGWLEKALPNMPEAHETLGRYKTFGDLAKGFWHARQLLGKKANSVLIPGEDASPEQVAEYRRAVGVPEDPSDYDIQRPEDFPEEYWSQESADHYSRVFHELNIPKAVADKLLEARVAEDRSRLQEALAMRDEQEQQFMDGEMRTLKAHWGDSFEKNRVAARRAAQTLGLNPDEPPSPSQFAMAMARVARLVSEDKLVQGDAAGPNGLSPEAAFRDIVHNPSNPWHDRYAKHDPEAVKYVNDLLSRGRRR